MAIIAPTGVLPKFLHAGPVIARRASANMRLLVTAVPPNPFEGSDAKIETATATDAPKDPQDSSRGIATATHQAIQQDAHKVGSQVFGTAQDLSEKAKQTVQVAWGSAKDTAQRVKETVVGKAEDAMACIKENAADANACVRENAADAKACVKENVADARATVKENRDTIKKAMNTKNC